MEDFFDQFKDNLENRPPPSFKEEDWKGLEKKLDQLNEPPRRVRLAWLVFPLLLLLLGSNGYLLYRLYQQPVESAQPTFKTDTIWKHSVVYHTDTIYRTKVIYETTNNRENYVISARANSENSITFTAANWTSFTENAFNGKNIAGTTPGLFPSYQLNALNQTLTTRQYAISSVWNKNNSTINSKDRYGLSPLLPRIDIPLLAAPFYFQGDTEIKIHDQNQRKRSFVQQLRRLRPIGIMGGITTGITQFTNELNNHHPSWSIGVHGSVIFSQKLRLWMEADYTMNRYEANRMDETIGIPIVQAPSDDFVFYKAETSIPAYLLGVGMEYIIRPDRKWSPYFGAGYGTVFTQPYEVTYDFTDSILGIEYNLEKQVNRQSTIPDFLILTGGMETHFSKKWIGQVGLRYQTNWDDLGQQWSNLFQLQGKLFYRF